MKNIKNSSTFKFFFACFITIIAISLLEKLLSVFADQTSSPGDLHITTMVTQGASGKDISKELSEDYTRCDLFYGDIEYELQVTQPKDICPNQYVSEEDYNIITSSSDWTSMYAKELYLTINKMFSSESGTSSNTFKCVEFKIVVKSVTIYYHDFNAYPADENGYFLNVHEAKRCTNANEAVRFWNERRKISRQNHVYYTTLTGNELFGRAYLGHVDRSDVIGGEMPDPGAKPTDAPLTPTDAPAPSATPTPRSFSRVRITTAFETSEGNSLAIGGKTSVTTVLDKGSSLEYIWDEELNETRSYFYDGYGTFFLPYSFELTGCRYELDGFRLKSGSGDFFSISDYCSVTPETERVTVVVTYRKSRVFTVEYIDYDDESKILMTHEIELNVGDRISFSPDGGSEEPYFDEGVLYVPYYLTVGDTDYTIKQYPKSPNYKVPSGNHVFKIYYSADYVPVTLRIWDANTSREIMEPMVFYGEYGLKISAIYSKLSDYFDLEYIDEKSGYRIRYPRTIETKNGMYRNPTFTARNSLNKTVNITSLTVLRVPLTVDISYRLETEEPVLNIEYIDGKNIGSYNRKLCLASRLHKVGSLYSVSEITEHIPGSLKYSDGEKETLKIFDGISIISSPDKKTHSYTYSSFLDLFNGNDSFGTFEFKDGALHLLRDSTIYLLYRTPEYLPPYRYMEEVTNVLRITDKNGNYHPEFAIPSTETLVFSADVKESCETYMVRERDGDPSDRLISDREELKLKEVCCIISGPDGGEIERVRLLKRGVGRYEGEYMIGDASENGKYKVILEAVHE